MNKHIVTRLTTFLLLMMFAAALSACGGDQEKKASTENNGPKIEKMIALKEAWAMALKDLLSRKNIPAEDARIAKIQSDSLKEGKSRGWTFKIFASEADDWDEVGDFDISVHDGEVGHLRRIGTAHKLQAMALKPVDKPVYMNSTDLMKTFVERGAGELTAFQNGRSKLFYALESSGVIKTIAGGIQLLDYTKVSATDRSNNDEFAVFFDPYSGAFQYRTQKIGGQEQRLP